MRKEGQRDGEEKGKKTQYYLLNLGKLIFDNGWKILILNKLVYCGTT
jgi:hypothetical protein